MLKVVSAVVLFAVCAMLIAGATGGYSKGDCVTVLKDSVHVYYEPEFESALVGWFVEEEPLSYRREDGEWWLVHGYGTDALGRKARMTGWVRASYMGGCPDASRPYLR